MQPLRNKALTCITALCFLLIAHNSAAVDIKLPSLGDTTSGIISKQQEYELGQSWLRAYRSRVPIYDDPELLFYLEQLTFKLSRYSQLKDHRLELLLINNPTMNAFAVPGGIIGIHTGLLRYAETEDQLGTVLAHELAHLSQRHFARQVENQQELSVANMAGLLASLILAATVSSDAGLAAMSATQAATLESSLRYSRSHEQEADRIGMATLYDAGMDPAAASQMFQKMMQATRYTGYKIPEFLLTHPLTEKRIADTANRVSQYPARQYPPHPEYHLMRARALLAIDKNSQRSIRRFKTELEGQPLFPEAAHYGLALAQIKAGNHEEARIAINQLITTSGNNLHYKMAEIINERKAGNLQLAITKAKLLQPLHPGYYPLFLAQAENYMAANQYDNSEAILTELSRTRSQDPKVWYLLAEVRGLAGNIAGVHLARAEYYILNGVFDKAKEQLSYAARLAAQDHKQSAIIAQRLREVNAMEAEAKKL